MVKKCTKTEYALNDAAVEDLGDGSYNLLGVTKTERYLRDLRDVISTIIFEIDSKVQLPPPSPATASFKAMVMTGP